MKFGHGLIVGAVLAMLGYFAAQAFTPEPPDVRDAVRTLTAQLDVAVAQRDSAFEAGFHRDTVLVELTDTVRVVVRMAEVRGDVAMDTLRARADSTEAVWLDSLNVAHADEVAAWQTLADERLLWGETWRTAAMAADSVSRIDRALTATYRAFAEAETRRAGRARLERNLSLVVNVVQLGERVYSKVAG